MESLRDVKRAMEREIKKGSCPIQFDRLEFGGAPFQIITSEEKLDEVLAYLLRIKSFRQYAEKTIINNVYMDLDMLCKKPQFKRTHSILEREGIYARVQKYKNGYSRIMTAALSGNGAVPLYTSRGGSRKIPDDL